jgi:hypothetical protein
LVNTNKRILSLTIVVGLIAMMMIIIITSNSNSGSKSSDVFLKLSVMAYGQSNGHTAINSAKLLVLLIHGYMEDAAVWNKWIDLLKKDGISVYPITFK